MGYNVCSKDHNGTKWQAGQKAQGCVSLTLNSTKKLCQSLYLHCLRPPLLLLVNMHAPNIQQEPGLGFCLCVVSCTVLCNDGVTKLPPQRRKNRRAREKSTFVFYLWGFLKIIFTDFLFIILFWRSHQFGHEFTKIQSQALLYRRLSDAHFAIIFSPSHLFPVITVLLRLLARLERRCVFPVRRQRRNNTNKLRANRWFIWPTSSTSGGTQNLSVGDKLSLCRLQKQ